MKAWVRNATGLRVVTALLLSGSLASAADDLLVVSVTGKPGGRLVYASRTEPRTLNPLMAGDVSSRELVPRLMADLIHINRATLQTEPALAKSWTVSADGLRYVIELRRGVRFSDGQPFDADDVVFTFQACLDEKVHAPQRDLLILDGKPIVVRKVDAYHVAFELPKPYAAVERLFDGFYILPQHLLAKAYAAGTLGEAWSMRTPPSEIAGLGPFRLRESVPGQHIILERNPYYWKSDRAGNRLPYLQEVDFVIAGTEDMQVLRFQSGESDILNRPSAKNFSLLAKDAGRRGYEVRNAGPGFEYNFLFFNLNDLPPNAPPQAAARHALFRRHAFRHAVSTAIDRDALVKLVYLGYATPLSSLVPPGNKLWLDASLPPLVRSTTRARQLLSADGFKWSPRGELLDASNQKVQFSIVASAGNPERVQMATIIQADLKELGIQVDVVPLEFRSLIDRISRSHEYDAAILSLASADADPNVDMNVWLSSGSSHLWHPEQSAPATPWEAEIDGLMRRQISTRNYGERKRLFDRVQELLMANLPMIPLVSPNILAGARRNLGNFRPVVLDHYTLWNIDELYWESGARR